MRQFMAELSKDEMSSSRESSIRDGALWSVMVGSGESVVQAFAIALGASTPLAIIALAIPNFVASMVQLLAVPLSNSIRTRRPWVSAGALIQRAMWLPIALLAFWASPYAFYALVAMYCIYLSFGALINPLWASWMAELVPENERGEYFSRRNKIMILITVLASIIAGQLLNDYAAFAKGTDYQGMLAPIFALFAGAGAMGGYALLFCIALLAGMASIVYLWKMKETPMNSAAHERIGLWELATHPAQAQSRKFALFIFFLMTGTYLASLIFPIYALTELKFDMGTFTIIFIAASIAKYLTLPYWGKLADRFGPRAVFITCGLMIPLVPLPWILTSNPYIIFMGEFFSGIVWGGFELACFNFVLGRAEKAHRTAAMAVYNLSKGFGLFFGAALSVLLWIVVLPEHPEFGSPFIALMILSALGRLAASAIFLPQFGKDSFGGMGMGAFLWQALAVNPGTGAMMRLNRTFSLGTSLFNSSIAYGGKAAKDGIGLVIYAMKRGNVMVADKIRIKKGL